MASNNIETKIRNYYNNSYTAIPYKDPPSLLAIQLQ